MHWFGEYVIGGDAGGAWGVGKNGSDWLEETKEAEGWLDYCREIQERSFWG